jgi:hypothetical protein
MAQPDKFERYYGVHQGNYTESPTSPHYMYRVSSGGSCWYTEWQESYCEQIFLANDSSSQSEYNMGPVCSMGGGLFKLTAYLELIRSHSWHRYDAALG